MDDPFNLGRFVAEQDALPFDAALAEIRRGRKNGHWIWFVFPQIRGLGRSETSLYFGIDSLAEAEAYVRHQILGPRLLLATEALADNPVKSVIEIVGELDAMKIRSSLTLFKAMGHGKLFGAALQTLFDGVECQSTRAFLSDVRRH